MSYDNELDARLKAIARAAAPGPSIADDVMRLIEQAEQTETAGSASPRDGDDAMISRGPAQGPVRLVPDVPTDLADGVQRGTHPIEKPPGRWHVPRRFIAMFQRRTVRWSVVAAVAAAVVLVIGLWPGKVGHGPASGIVWADVVRDLQQDLKSRQTMHLVARFLPSFYDDIGLGLPPKGNRTEIWASRPGKYRREQGADLPPNATQEQLKHWHDTSKTEIYNADGFAVLLSEHKIWGFASREAKAACEGRPFDEFVDDQLEAFLGLGLWKRATAAKSPEGKIIGEAQVRGQAVTVYEFAADRPGFLYKAWLRDSDHRAVGIEVYRDGQSEPVASYDPIEYDVEIPSELFVTTMPAGYTDGQLIGYEDKPKEMNPDTVALVQEPDSVSFYKLNIEPGHTRDEAIAAARARGFPDLRIFVTQDPNDCHVQGREVGMSGRDLRTLGFVANYPADVLMCGVRPAKVSDHPDSMPTELVPASECKGRQVVYRVLAYRTDRRRIKAAYDADGDGKMDAWAEAYLEPPSSGAPPVIQEQP